MYAGRTLENTLLQSPRERPFKGIARNMLYGSLIAVVFVLFGISESGFSAKNLLGYILVGNAFSFFGWGAERLWYSTVSKMLHEPFSWSAYCTRIPFWYVGGGIAYTLAMLTAKQNGLLDAYDIPVKQLFNFGARIGCAIQVPLQIVMYRTLKPYDTY